MSEPMQYRTSSPINANDSTSVTDNSSESFTSYSDEFYQLSPSIKLYPRLSSTFKSVDPTQFDEKHKTSKQNQLTDDTIHEMTNLTDTENISVWERWLVSKLQLDKEKNRHKRKQAKLEKEEKEKKRIEAEERKMKAQQRHQEWLEEKLLKMKIQRTREKREQKLKREIETEKAAATKIKADLIYKQWLEKHNDVDREKHLQEKKMKEEEMTVKEEKKKKAQETYKQWLQDNKERFIALKKQGQPAPSYINPIPWIGPEEDETRRHPGPSQPQVKRDNRRPLTRSQNVTLKRCSTPKPRSRGLETHTPLRTGKPSTHASPSASLIRICTPLRFSGYRPKSKNSRRNQPEEAKRPASSQSVTSVPQPLRGMRSKKKNSRNCFR